MLIMFRFHRPIRSTRSYDCLLNRSFEVLNSESLFGAIKAKCRWHTDWAPSVDDVELTELVWSLAVKGQLADVPVILGFNRDEGARDALV